MRSIVPSLNSVGHSGFSSAEHTTRGADPELGSMSIASFTTGLPCCVSTVITHERFVKPSATVCVELPGML